MSRILNYSFGNSGRYSKIGKTEKIFRRDTGQLNSMWIYGLNPVLEALRARRNIKEVYISSGRHEKLFLIKKKQKAEGLLSG